MYSKETGYTTIPAVPRHPSYRQPPRPRMQVPPNYSGHAIVDGEERPLGQTEPPAEYGDTPPAEGPVPHFDDLPRVSELGETRYRPPARAVPRVPFEAQEPPPEEPSAEPAETREAPPPEEAPSVLPAEPPRMLRGHGLGWEEMLILGLIWLLIHENSVGGRDRGDLDETILLLGLLLVLG